MFHRVLAFLRRPRATHRLQHYRAQLGRLQPVLEVVNDGLLRGDITIEDLGAGVGQGPNPMPAEPADAAAR